MVVRQLLRKFHWVSKAAKAGIVLNGYRLFVEKGIDEAVNENNRIKCNLLRFFCDFELNRPLGEMDEEIINEYVADILELSGKKISLTPEEISVRVARIPFK